MTAMQGVLCQAIAERSQHIDDVLATCVLRWPNQRCQFHQQADRIGSGVGKPLQQIFHLTHISPILYFIREKSISR